MTRLVAVAAGIGLALGLGGPVAAQGAFQSLDPFYGGETAARAFYGEFALSGEVGYSDTDLIRPQGSGSTGGNLSLSGRLDYALLPQVDLSLVADLSGGVGRGPLGVSWVVVKPYWHNDLTDYAVRVAVDPSSGGGLGFRQTDVAFLSSTTLGPTVTTDFSVGLRRVRTGFTRSAETETFDNDVPLVLPDPDAPVPNGFLLDAATSDRVRVVGQELHGAWGYNVLFDPAGSRLIVGLEGRAGQYRLVNAGGTRSPTDASDAPGDRIRVGTGWARLGLEFSRPSYQLSPFVSVPLVTWTDDQGDIQSFGPRPDKARLGLRVTLR